MSDLTDKQKTILAIDTIGTFVQSFGQSDIYNQICLEVFLEFLMNPESIKDYEQSVCVHDEARQEQCEDIGSV